MVTFYVIVVAFATVFKMMFAVVVGVFLSPQLSEPVRTEKGFSYLSVRIFVACMMFGNMCLDLSFDLFSQYYWAVIMSLVPMALGGIASFLTFRLVGREYRPLIILGATFQNGLVFPLSVVTNIKGIAWLDDKAVAECQQYVFLYNLCCGTFLWAIGGAMVKHFKDKSVREKEEAAEDAYYERRKVRNLKRFMKEIKDRATGGGGGANKEDKEREMEKKREKEKARLKLEQEKKQKEEREKEIEAQRRFDEQFNNTSCSNTNTTDNKHEDDIDPELVASFVFTVGGAIQRGLRAEARRTASLCGGGGGTASDSFTSRQSAAAAFVLSPGSTGAAVVGGGFGIGTPATSPTTAAGGGGAFPTPQPVALTESQSAIIAEYRKHFAPKPQSGVVFPQLQDPAVREQQAQLHAQFEAAAAAATTTANGTSGGGGGPAAAAATAPTVGVVVSGDHHRHADGTITTTTLGEDARPTVQGQLRWYRPAKRKARPIDTAKFDSWKQRAFAAQGQGGDGGGADLGGIDGGERSASPGGGGGGDGPEAPTVDADGFTNDIGHLNMLDATVGPDGGADVVIVPFPPALGEGIYSDNTANIGDGYDGKKKGKKHDHHPWHSASSGSKGIMGGADGGAASTTATATTAATAAGNLHELRLLGIDPPPPPIIEGHGEIFVRNSDNIWAYRCRKFKEASLFALQTPPVYITIIAVLISIVPPLRWLAETTLGLAFIKGIDLVGQICVPFQLLALGCTLAAKKKQAAPLILQENLDSEDVSEEDSDDDEDAVAQEKKAKSATAAAGADGQQQQQECTATEQATGDQIIAAMPAFDVARTIEVDADRAEEKAAVQQSNHKLVIVGSPREEDDFGDQPRHHHHHNGGNEDGDGSGSGKGHDITTTTSKKKKGLSAARKKLRKQMDPKHVQRQLRKLAFRQKREMISAMGSIRRFWHRIPDATRFTILVIVLRLLLLPAIAFALVHWLIQLGVMPMDRSFIVSILIAVSSPGSVNASLICTLNDYHSGEYSRMILIMYCLASVTCTFWLAASIMYTSAFIPLKVLPVPPEDW